MFKIASCSPYWLQFNFSMSLFFCHIGNFYVGTLACANDLVLIAPTASAMRKMLASYPYVTVYLCDQLVAPEIRHSRRRCSVNNHKILIKTYKYTQHIQLHA